LTPKPGGALFFKITADFSINIQKTIEHFGFQM